MKPAQLLRRWGLVAVLALVAVGSWQAAQQGDTDEERLDPVVYPRALSTPLLSARRVPRTLQAPVVDADIAPSIQAAIAASPPTSCLVVRAGHRVLQPAANVDTAMVPASNEKLLTTSVALDVLGSGFRYHTAVRADAAPVGGVVNGNLYLVGSGDPFLGTDEWWAQYDQLDGRFHTRMEDLVAAVKRAGITQVTGTVVGDESLFDAQRQGPWAQRLVAARESGPLSALTVNEGFTDWPERAGSTAKARVPADNPPVAAATVLAQMLSAQGVGIVNPAIGAGTTPAAAVEVAGVDSPPLSDVITHVNSYSMNMGAELLLKRLGVAAAAEGSTQGGSRVVLSRLQARGVPADGLRIDDGSGLAETDRVSCRALVAVLAAAGPDSPLAASLSIGGTRGSLLERMVATPARGRVLAKTGTLNDVAALSGFVHSATDPEVTLTFAYVANQNQLPIEATRAVQDTLMAALTSYPSGPAASDLGPLAPQ